MSDFFQAPSGTVVMRAPYKDVNSFYAIFKGGMLSPALPGHVWITLADVSPRITQETTLIKDAAFHIVGYPDRALITTLGTYSYNVYSVPWDIVREISDRVKSLRTPSDLSKLDGIVESFNNYSEFDAFTEIYDRAIMFRFPKATLDNPENPVNLEGSNEAR